MDKEAYEIEFEDIEGFLKAMRHAVETSRPIKVGEAARHMNTRVLNLLEYAVADHHSARLQSLLADKEATIKALQVEQSDRSREAIEPSMVRAGLVPLLDKYGISMADDDIADDDLRTFVSGLSR